MSSYPVEFMSGGVVRLAGSLAFTDPTSQPAVAPFQLAAQAASGTATIQVSNASPLLDTHQFIVIGPRTPGALLRRVLNVSGSTLTVDRNLTATFPAGTAVFLLYGGPQPIPWSMWGGKASGSQADATTNVAAFNNLSQEIYRLTIQNGWGIGLDSGTFYINDQLKLERSQTVSSMSPLSSVVAAADSFPFTTDGSVAMLHPQRDGLPVTYHGGPSGQWTLRNFKLDGRSLPNSNGLLTSPQQPGSMRDLYFSGFAGLYGLTMSGQVQPTYNLEFDACNLPIDLHTMEFVSFDQLNITNTTGTKMIVIGGSSKQVKFANCDLETMNAGGTFVSVEDNATGIFLDNVYSSGFIGGASGTFINFNAVGNPGGNVTWRITGTRFDQNSNSITMLHDAQRNITLNAFSDTNREIVDAWAQDSQYWIVCGGLNKVKTNVSFVT